jgi:DNA-binding PadR family transcriptional regulator
MVGRVGPRSTDPRAVTRLPLQPRDYLILLALSDGPLHGHGLLKTVEAQAGGVLFDPANLYRLLRKLEREGAVTEVAEHRKGPRPHRRRYALTPLGRSVLVAESERLAHLTEAARKRRLLPHRFPAR